MKWALVDRQHTVIAYADASTKLGAVAKLKPDPTRGEVVTSVASFKVGYSRTVLTALLEGPGICTFCEGNIPKGEGRPRTSLHERCYRKQALLRRFRGR